MEYLTNWECSPDYYSVLVASVSWQTQVGNARVAEAVHGAALIVVVHRCTKHGSNVLEAMAGGKG
jgi:hypothetical protein